MMDPHRDHFVGHICRAHEPGAKYEKVFRVLYYTPVITSVVAVSFIFQRMFMSDGGTINTFLMSLGIKNPPNWMSHPGYTKWVIIIMAVWKGLGSSIIMYIAGMQGISSTYYEAAKIDGAGWFYTFRKITLPLLMPVTFYLLVTGIIGGAQMYVEPRLIFTGNGPANSTFTTVIHLYDNTFRNSKAGYGSAVAIVLGIIVFLVTALQFYINGRGDRLKRQKKIADILIFIFLAAGSAVMLHPFIWMIFTSFKPKMHIYLAGLLPRKWTSGHIQIWSRSSCARIPNTILYSVPP